MVGNGSNNGGKSLADAVLLLVIVTLVVVLARALGVPLPLLSP